MIKAAILAGNNPAVPRLMQILEAHPDVELVAYAQSDNKGERLDELFPFMKGETELIVTDSLDPEAIDVVFIADRPGAAQQFIKTHTIPENLRIIDLDGHDSDGDAEFVPGIAELNRKVLVRGAKYVVMPDNATLAVALGLLPMAKNLLINSPFSSAVVTKSPDAESDTLRGEIFDKNILNELKTALSSLQASFSAPIAGTLFSGDIPSGTTAITRLTSNVSIEELNRLYDEFYADHSFTFRVDEKPDAADVRGTNKCFIHLEKEGDEIIITTVFDTDVKGGAGNAVHAMNLLFGLLEKVAL